MANSNKGFNTAKKEKKNEFYTQLSDIENELWHYKDHFKGKTVLCNCDDPRVSNFFRYFAQNFKELGLKKLITTCYKNQDVDLFSTEKHEQAIYLEYYGNPDYSTYPDVSEIEIKPLKGDGDFRSKECLDLLDQSDIVVTNPPFSLFSEFVSTLIKHNKKFLIIGRQTSVTFKEIFPLIKENKLWLGYGFKRNCAWFINHRYEDYATDTDHREGLIRVSGVFWYTNMEIEKTKKDRILYVPYSPETHPKFDNYDAIFIAKSKDIPYDYDGLMAVPITFLTSYNPNQFELLYCSAYSNPKYYGCPTLYLNGEKKFARIILRRRR